MSVFSYHSTPPSEAEKQLLVRMRAKDESILSLQTENAALRLKLAELRALVNTTRLQKDYMRRQFMHAHSAMSSTRKKLNLCQSTIQALRFDVDEMRSHVEGFPNISASSLQTCGQMFEQLQNQVLLKSDSLVSSLKEQLKTARKDYSSLQTLYEQEKKRRKALHNTVVELRGNIRVHCRLRPMLAFDQRTSSGTSSSSGVGMARTNTGLLEEVILPIDEETVCVHTLKQQLSGVGVSNKNFEFDRVYGPSSNQSDVFAEVQPLLTSLLDGYNACLMAYGQTGSGKTHSMLGDGLESGVSSSDVWWNEKSGSPGKYPPQCIHHGIIPRAAVEVFRLIGERSADCRVAVDVSVVEIYNNEIYDLLKGSSSKCDISFKEDGSVNLLGVTRREAENSQDVMKSVLLGLQRRAEAATGVHQHSSRSHLIITLNLHTTLLAGDTGQQSIKQSNLASGTSPPRNVARTLSFDGSTGIPRTPTGRPPSPHRSSSKSAAARSHSPPVAHSTPLKASFSLPMDGSHITSRRAAASTSATITNRSAQLHAQSASFSDSTVMSQTPRVIHTKLQLVDLAGSECAAMSGVDGMGQREASFINRSLSSLADVLAALAKKQQHVPYRNSKLTHILQDTIGGDAKLLVLTCVAPAQRYLTESMQCLQFGSRIRQVQRGAAPRARSTSSTTSASTKQQTDPSHNARDRRSMHAYTPGRESPRSSR
eukprot:scpid37116/ scgid5076/ Kinesin-like protein KIFC3